jgi:hypothetical protein
MWRRRRLKEDARGALTGAVEGAEGVWEVDAEGRLGVAAGAEVQEGFEVGAAGVFNQTLSEHGPLTTWDMSYKSTRLLAHDNNK